MTQYKYLIIVLVWVASIVVSHLYGIRVGSTNEVNKANEIKAAIEDARTKMQEAAADEIAKITVRNTTIQGRVQTIIKDNPVYRDCNHDDATIRMLNETITGSGSKPSESGLPATNTIK